MFKEKLFCYLKFRHFIMIVVLGCLLFNNIGLSSVIEIEARIPQKNDLFSNAKMDSYDSLENRKLLLFIIDFNDFMCLSCLDSFLDFYYCLPSDFQKNMSWGILVFNISEKEGNNNISARIAEKKLRGFVAANNIKFPILIDKFHVFNGLAEEGTVVMVFDWSRKMVKRYVFPLNKGQIEEIFKFLTE